MATRVEDIYESFSAGVSIVSDEEARLSMKNLRISYNAESNILGYIAALAHICHYKPHLFQELFVYPADAFVCMGVGNHTKAHIYIDFLLNDPKGAAYRPLSSQARAWLQEQWPMLKSIADTVLGNMMKEALED